MTEQQIYDHNRYLRNRERILERNREYYQEYTKKGLSKPRKQRKSRSATDHERYLRNRERILEQQRIYRKTHKEEIRERRRQRNYQRVYGRPYI